MVTNVLLDGKNKLLFPVIIGIAYLVFILIYSSDAIQMKIEQSQNLNAHSSFAIRFADNVALLESIKDKPITGWGSDSLSLLKTLVNRGSVTNSNGVFLAAAELGVVYVFMWFVMLFRGLRRIYNLQLAIGFFSFQVAPSEFQSALKDLGMDWKMWQVILCLVVFGLYITITA